MKSFLSAVHRFWALGYVISVCFALPAYTSLSVEEVTTPAIPRRLVIVLDGVPYETMIELRAEGHFRRFREPARMISTFPSLTNPAMIEILNGEASPGYEDHYFDRTDNRLVGGIQDRFRGGKFINGTFRETFDYHANAAKGSFAYVSAPLGTIAVAQLDLVGFGSAFRKSKSPIFVGYIGATDSLAHLGGRWPLKSLLRSLDRSLEEMIEEAERRGGRLEVEIFSDHGNRYGDYREVKLNPAIEKAGFKIEKSLKSEQSVVLPRYGLVGSSELYTAPQNRSRLAEVCAQIEGVDFAVYPSTDNSIELISRRGRARLLRDGDKFGYQALDGDPLALAPIIDTMKRRGVTDDRGFAAREDWWIATRDHDYADPVRRVFDGFNSFVKNRADLIVSYQDGYLLGSPLMSFFARMRATHGNLLRGETEGFAISTRQDLGGSIRGYELNRLFSLDQRSKAEGYVSGEGHCQLGPELARRIVGIE